jgi:hypothetical protein
LIITMFGERATIQSTIKAAGALKRFSTNHGIRI